ncbi:hypothetical protein EVAR_53256_1 [Eumeta japonica]|uniref:Uncharacterized protein n=1 Tax=Eumeta variegata TaxID=151549 RepID=A0A4C1YKC6_EUMVA|nr:hypothetical protein EVAR_53256_1 [Eumeta japonica]
MSTLLKRQRGTAEGGRALLGAPASLCAARDSHLLRDRWHPKILIEDEEDLIASRKRQFDYLPSQLLRYTLSQNKTSAVAFHPQSRSSRGPFPLHYPVPPPSNILFPTQEATMAPVTSPGLRVSIDEHNNLLSGGSQVRLSPEASM